MINSKYKSEEIILYFPRVILYIKEITYTMIMNAINLYNKEIT